MFGKECSPVALFFGGLWLTGIGAGFWVFQTYKWTPDSPGHVPLLSTRTLEISGREAPAVLVFAHPHCPCARATISELAIIVAESSTAVVVDIAFVEPEGAPKEWKQTPLWSIAGSIPGVRTRWDRGGSLAKRLGITTSGHVLVHDPEGNLLFSGGITAYWRHRVDNPGRRGVLACLEGTAGKSRETPVFGCPLFAPDHCCTGGSAP